MWGFPGQDLPVLQYKEDHNNWEQCSHGLAGWPLDISKLTHDAGLEHSILTQTNVIQPDALLRGINKTALAAVLRIGTVSLQSSLGPG